MEITDKPERFELLKKNIEKIVEKIIKNEEIDYKFGNEILNSIKERIEKKNEEKIWQYLIEGLALIQIINQEKEFFEENKDLALESLKIGQEIQSDIKKEIGNLIIQGKKKMANEIQEFNYKLFEALGFLRAFEEKGNFEEIEISLKPHLQKRYLEEEKRKMIEIANLIKNATDKLTIKRIEKKGFKFKKLIYILLCCVLIFGVYSLFSIKKGKKVEYVFNVSDFPEIPNNSNIQKESYGLKIIVPEEFWNELNKKKKMEIINKITVKIDEKGYLMLEFYSNSGEKLGKWVKNERTYIYK